MYLHLWVGLSAFLPGDSHAQRSLVGYSPWGRKESDTTEWLNLTVKQAWVAEEDTQESKWKCLHTWSYLSKKGRTQQHQVRMCMTAKVVSEGCKECYRPLCLKGWYAHTSFAQIRNQRCVQRTPQNQDT